MSNYNPNAWNAFPDVKPPRNVLMSVEYECQLGQFGALYTMGSRFKWNGKDWFTGFKGECLCVPKAKTSVSARGRTSMKLSKKRCKTSPTV